jgi:hypothetical protein
MDETEMGKQQKKNTPIEKPQSIGGGQMTCQLCGNDRFDIHTGKIDSKWGVTALKVDLVICTQCKYTHLFYKGRTIWDFD